MRQPKYWNTQFRVNVIGAYEHGELNFYNVAEWETKYNGGVRPSNMGTEQILKYYLAHEGVLGCGIV